MFEMWSEAYGLDETMQRAALVTAARGAARDYLLSLPDLKSMTYHDIKSTLLDNYLERSRMYLSSLYSMK